MNYFDKNKILTIAVVALIITNLGILVYLWCERSQNFKSTDRMPPGERMQRHEGKPPQDRLPSEGGPKEFLIRELKLKKKQKAGYISPLFAARISFPPLDPAFTELA